MYHQKRTRRKTNKWRKKVPKTEHRYAKYVRQVQAEIQAEDDRNTAYWTEIRPILQNMYDELTALGKPPAYNQAVKVIEYCVKIFDIVSRCQDQLEGREIRVCPGKLSEVVTSFNNDIYFIGRHAEDDKRHDQTYGDVPYWNTTKIGEPINLETIYFGPDWGKSRMPASYWIKLSKKKKMTIYEEQHFATHSIKRPKDVWVTEAMVRSGILQICKLAYKNFTSYLEEILTFQFV